MVQNGEKAGPNEMMGLRVMYQAKWWYNIVVYHQCHGFMVMNPMVQFVKNRKKLQDSDPRIHFDKSLIKNHPILIESMGLAYLPTRMVNLYGKCRNAPYTDPRNYGY